MKIYTKTGDKGETSLLGGQRVPKHHIRIESYGTTDELNSLIGMIRDLNNDNSVAATLESVQDRLFVIGSNLATQSGKENVKTPKLEESDIILLEKEIDRMNDTLPDLTSFILPGGDVTASWCHIARCVCRRSERQVTALAEHEPVPEIIIKYLNRLSDYLFTLARFFINNHGGKEILWKPIP